MDSPNRPAVPEEINGFGGDRYNYGLRAYGHFPEKGFFYGGTAQQNNLRSGFQIVKFTARKPRP
jgi:hypothetical protein